MENMLVTLKSGLKINTLIGGRENNQPLVLLHGYPTDSRLWRHCLPDLSGRFRVYAPDLPGHGRSDKALSQDFDLDFLLNFLLDFYDALGLSRPHLAAHDFGGMVALGLAGRFPERVDRLVILNTAADPDWPLSCSVMVGMLRFRLIAWLALRPCLFRMMLRTASVNKRIFDDGTAGLYRDSWTYSRDSRLAFRHVIMAPRERATAPAETVRRINAPTLILWGKKDPVLTPGQAWKLNGYIKDSQLIWLEDCGHFVPEEKPAEVTANILNFLK